MYSALPNKLGKMTFHPNMLISQSLRTVDDKLYSPVS